MKIGETAHKPVRSERRQHTDPERCRSVSAWFRKHARQQGKRLADRRQKPVGGRGRLHAVALSLKKPGSKPGLEIADRMADRAVRQSQLLRSPLVASQSRSHFECLEGPKRRQLMHGAMLDIFT
jgi:hypothetical protein